LKVATLTDEASPLEPNSSLYIANYETRDRREDHANEAVTQQGLKSKRYCWLILAIALPKF